MEHQLLLQQGDSVFYVGQKHKQDLLTKDGKPMRGYIHATVANQPNVYVVEFPEAKGGDYIMHVSLLTQYRPSKIETMQGPHIQPRRPKAEDEEAK